MTRLDFLSAALVLIGIAALPGCSGEKTYHLSGTVTYKGKPVPKGQIVFEPDASAGNSGQPAYASIVDGHYDTRDDCQGTVGGPHIVQIHGRDGIPRGELLNGLPLFRDYSTTVDIPKGSNKQDFEVPSGDRG
jgi:hypothetical protein